MNILVVDDNRLMLASLRHIIKNNGHTVYTSESGSDAIGVVNDEKIDLIICDVMMPEISGMSLVSVLRNVSLFKNPIIMISTLDTDFVISKSIELGANDFIAKPFSSEQLMGKIKTYSTDKV